MRNNTTLFYKTVKLIKSVQISRAIAAISVVIFHLNLFKYHAGKFGVDIFFIISGFIIAYVVNKTTESFFLKRIKRVSPLYYIATLLTILLAVIFPRLFKHVVITPEAIAKSLLYIPYTIGKSGPILSLGWTLNNEMLFYVVMFLCILITNKKKYLVPLCGFIIAVFLFSLEFIKHPGFGLQFYKDGLIPEFIFGLGLYYFNIYYKANNKYLNGLLIAVGFISFIFMAYAEATNNFYNLSRNIVIGIPALFFINALLLLENYINGKNAIVKLFLKLGDASFAMYLFHPFVIFALERLIFPRFKLFNQSNIFQFIELVISLVMVCGVSILIYDFIDKPINDKLKTGKKIIALKH